MVSEVNSHESYAGIWAQYLGCFIPKVSKHLFVNCQYIISCSCLDISDNRCQSLRIYSRRRQPGPINDRAGIRLFRLVVEDRCDRLE